MESERLFLERLASRDVGGDGMKLIHGFVALTLIVGCRTKDVAADGDATAAAPLSSAATSDRGPELVAGACLSCHSEEILLEQRLTSPQWEKVVKKMSGWGATVSADDVPVVSAYLAARYGVDAGTFAASTVLASEATSEIAPIDDGPFARGSEERGGPLYAAQCASCHGTDARGQTGVNLVDRPLLYRAAEFARAIREGRGKMPARPTSDADVADLLAHLRHLRARR
jgi:mono/diheme cytochrome c family protein